VISISNMSPVPAVREQRVRALATTGEIAER
jgi:hypothetical protein